MSVPLPECRQHAVACAALGLCSNLVETWGSSGLPQVLKQIRRHASLAEAQTRMRKRVSRGAQRAWDKYATILASRLQSGGAPEENDRLWATLVWVVFVLILEVRHSCPLYQEGMYKGQWNMLFHWLDYLAQEQLGQFPDCGDAASDIYLEASEALEDCHEAEIRAYA